MEKDRRIRKVVFRILMISGFCLLGISCHYHAMIGKSDLKTISQECIEESDTEKIIKNGDYFLILREGDEGFAVFLQNGKEIVGSQELPAWITVRGSDTLPTGEYIETDYKQPYHQVIRKKYGFCATASVHTEKGSVFIVEDKYTLLKDGVFGIYRDVKVKEAQAEDVGFASTISFQTGLRSSDNNDFEYFIPSVLYRNTSEVREDAIAADLNTDRMYVKETRTGLPLAMLREKVTGATLTLMHYNPRIDVGQNPGGGTFYEVNDALQYGSIGYSIYPLLSVDFHYPCAEGPRTYEVAGRKRDAKTIWSKRYHSVKEGNIHSYSVALIPDKKDNYNEAMMYAFGMGYKTEEPTIVDMNMDEIYRQNIELFKAEYRMFGKGNIKAAGLPWSLDLPDGTNTEGISFQMGFVGQQIAVGYHMYRYGLDHHDSENKRKGKSMVDFWVSDAIMKTYFPTVWWDPADNATAGQRREYPSFLRCFVDGMEGLLDAYRISVAHNEPQEAWNQALKRVASNLVKKQNEDGSFYRAYKTNGDVETGGDRNTHGTSKLNTPVAIRFLVKMFEHTGETKYKEAAIKAADFSYNELYLKLGKYVGGTPDNPNTVDKEAAIFALYGFNAIHELTGDLKYLKAAEHAANCAMSWTYCYDFAIPNRDAMDTKKNPFVKGGITGFSIIATGHSGADNFIAYVFYEMYKLYIKTGNELYLYMAKFLQNNTKLNTDFDGRMNYKYRAFMPEATNVADLAFRSVSLWLPWASIANIEPIVNLEEAFGKKDLSQIDMSLPELRSRLTIYGVGGKPLHR